MIDEHRLHRGVEALLQIELTSNCLNIHGKEEYAFSVDKKNSREKDDFVLEDLSGTSESFPTELSLITEEKRLINVEVLHSQRNDREDEGNFFVFFFFSITGRARFEDHRE